MPICAIDLRQSRAFRLDLAKSSPERQSPVESRIRFAFPGRLPGHPQRLLPHAVPELAAQSAVPNMDPARALAMHPGSLARAAIANPAIVRQSDRLHWR